MPAQDTLIAEAKIELEECQNFIDHLLEQAHGRDLNASEEELMMKKTDRMAVVGDHLGKLIESQKISMRSRERISEITKAAAISRNPVAAQATMEYRTAGQYIVDRWQAGVGIEEARQRLEMYHRAAAHQTTSDNLGIIPNPVIGSVLNYIDSSRPIVSVLGPMDVPGGRFTRPKITQHTDVALQSAEKGELVSRKMLISAVNVDMKTYGGYVNISRQNLDWSVPSIMDLVVNDLAAEYAIETEQVTAAAVAAAATAQTPVITAASTAAEVTAAIWKAAGASYAAMQGAGRPVLVVSSDMMGAIGPLFTPLTLTNPGVTTGFTAGSFGNGPQGSISGITVVMSTALAAGTAIMINTASTEVYEQRLGSLQVTEPSVLGVQVAYAGYFAVVVLTATGVIKLTA